MESYDAHKSTTEVRQGNKRRMNLRVLIISTLLLCVLFGVLYAISAMQTPPTAV